MRLGAYDVPQQNPWSTLNLGVIDSPAHRSLAWRAAVSSAVLLENAEGALGLPIQMEREGSLKDSPAGDGMIAVLGDFATASLVGRSDYTGTTTKHVSLLAGIQNRAAIDGMEVRYSARDISVAVGASVVVVVVQSEQEGESHDRANVTMRQEDSNTLVKLQQQQQGKGCKVVVIVISGGPVDTSQPAAAMGSGGVATSVIAAWQIGEEGGNAIAALLWGDVDFSAALAVTIYRQNFTTAADIANVSLAGRGYRYISDRSLELYPFGYGLSYNTWATPALVWTGGGTAAKSVPAVGMDLINVTVTVRNTEYWHQGWQSTSAALRAVTDERDRSREALRHSSHWWAGMATQVGWWPLTKPRASSPVWNKSSH
jgi:beta-glucosidase